MFTLAILQLKIVTRQLIDKILNTEIDDKQLSVKFHSLLIMSYMIYLQVM
jgi:hypothetical protein